MPVCNIDDGKVGDEFSMWSKFTDVSGNYTESEPFEQRPSDPDDHSTTRLLGPSHAVLTPTSRSVLRADRRPDARFETRMRMTRNRPRTSDQGGTSPFPQGSRALRDRRAGLEGIA